MIPRHRRRRAAEEFIRGEIEKAYPTHTIIGEEFGETSSAESIRLSASSSAHRWFIDPSTEPNPSCAACLSMAC